MAKNSDMAKIRLFGTNSLNVSNIKLFPGNSREATVEDMAGEINKVLSQLEAGEYEDLSFDPA